MGTDVAKQRFPAEMCWASSKEENPWPWPNLNKPWSPSILGRGQRERSSRERES